MQERDDLLQQARREHGLRGEWPEQGRPFQEKVALVEAYFFQQHQSPHGECCEEEEDCARHGAPRRPGHVVCHWEFLEKSVLMDVCEKK